MPCLGFPNMVADSRPAFMPITFQSWKREIKLRISGQSGATATQLLGEQIRVLPQEVKTASLIYMKKMTEIQPIDPSRPSWIWWVADSEGPTRNERARGYPISRIPSGGPGELQGFLGTIRPLCGQSGGARHADGRKGSIQSPDSRAQTTRVATPNCVICIGNSTRPIQCLDTERNHHQIV